MARRRRVYSASPATVWLSACTQELLFQSCPGTAGQVEFRVTYYLSGVVPTGQSQYASNFRDDPYKLTVSSLVCGSAFLMAISSSAAGSPPLWAQGYTSFTVSK